MRSRSLACFTALACLATACASLQGKSEALGDVTQVAAWKPFVKQSFDPLPQFTKLEFEGMKPAHRGCVREIEAIARTMKAAEKGDAKAQYAIALLYRDTETRDDKAERARKASSQESAAADQKILAQVVDTIALLELSASNGSLKDDEKMMLEFAKSSLPLLAGELELPLPVEPLADSARQTNVAQAVLRTQTMLKPLWQRDNPHLHAMLISDFLGLAAGLKPPVQPISDKKAEKTREKFEVDDCPVSPLQLGRDWLASIKWLKLAADQRLPEAQHALGLVFWEGYNRVEAMRLFAEAQKQGFILPESGEARQILAQISKTRDLLAAAKAGDTQAALALADAYFYEKGIVAKNRAEVDKISKKEAAKWYRFSASRGKTAAMLDLIRNSDKFKLGENEAARWLGLAVDAGNREAEYLMGEKTGQLKWFERAAAKGYLPAKYALIKAHDEGRGTQRDYAKALKLARETISAMSEGERARYIPFSDETATPVAADENDSPSGDYSPDLRNFVREAEEREVYRSAVRKGGYDGLKAQFDLARSYLHYDQGGSSIYLAPDPAQAALWFGRVAENHLLSTAQGRKLDEYQREAVISMQKEAREYLTEHLQKKADTPSLEARAKNGDAEAQLELGREKFKSGAADEGIRSLRLAAEQGNSDAAQELGNIYLRDKRFRNLTEARKWIGKTQHAEEWLNVLSAFDAAEKGNGRAQYALSVYYKKTEDADDDWQGRTGNNLSGYVRFEDGINTAGVVPNARTSLRWLQTSAKQGYAPAQYELGRIRLKAHSKEAADLLGRAAAQGFAPAQYFYGKALYFGWGMSRNEKDGLSWIQRAAESAPKYRKVLGHGRYEYEESDKIIELAKSLRWFQRDAKYWVVDIADSAVASIVAENATLKIATGVSPEYALELANVDLNVDLKMLLRDANGGDAESMFALGALLYNHSEGTDASRYSPGLCVFCNRPGKDVKSNDATQARGLQWIHKAAVAGQPIALELAGLIVENGDTGLDRHARSRIEDVAQEIIKKHNAIKALEEYSPGSEVSEEFVDNYRNAVVAFFNPRYIEPDPVQGMALIKRELTRVAQAIKKANGLKDEDTVYQLESLQEEMKSTLKDVEKMAALRNKAVSGNRDAQYELGVAGSYRGDLQKKERQKWLRKAAAAGQADAQYQLARFYLGNDTYLKNDNSLYGIGWLLKAAEQGHEGAWSELPSDKKRSSW